jgi:uncharacterized repeat protein (TIGR03847 family)
MPGQHIELHVINRITINTIGPPGQRVFLFQASDAVDTVTLKLEKEQARALAHTAEELLDNLDKEHPLEDSTHDRPASGDFMLKNPLDPMFQIGQIGLGYDQSRDMIVLATQELLLDESEEPSTARFWVSRSQLRALSKQTLGIVEQGRPVCPLCGRPIDPDGHFCPRSNGHDKVVQ